MLESLTLFSFLASFHGVSRGFPLQNSGLLDVVGAFYPAGVPPVVSSRPFGDRSPVRPGPAAGAAGAAADLPGELRRPGLPGGVESFLEPIFDGPKIRRLENVGNTIQQVE